MLMNMQRKIKIILPGFLSGELDSSDVEMSVILSGASSGIASEILSSFINDSAAYK